MPKTGQRMLRLGLVAWGIAAAAAVVDGQSPRVAPAEISRAVAYLAVEVPRWRREHPCYSCHNNGDGARALVMAAARGLFDLQQVNDATGWLRTPERWALNSEEGGVKDLPLSRIQFASALLALQRSGAAEQASVDRAASLLIADQRPDGSWPISATSTVGTPSGYGTPLATAAARQVLRASDTAAARAAVARSDSWFRAAEPQAVLEASAVLLGLDAATDPAAVAARTRAMTILERGQGPDGGWGPYTTSRSESFDTAVALLALLSFRADPSLASPVMTETEWRTALERGRAFLGAEQNDDGSWAETTRPTGQESYSQRVSTTAWALLALLSE